MDGYVTIGTELDLSGVEKRLDQMVAIMEKKTSAGAEKAAAKASKKLATGMTLGISVLNNVVGKLMNVVGGTIDDAISRMDILNNFPKVMTSLGMSTKDSAQAVDYLSEKLLELPTTLDESVANVQKFAAINENVEASTEMYLALNNAVLAGGANAQQTASAIYQMVDAYSKGKPDMQDWKAIMSAAPAQMKQVAKAMGYVNGQALGKALREGTVSMNDFMLTLVKLNHEGLNGYASLEEQAKKGTAGIRTSLMNLKNSIVRAVAEVIKTIGYSNIIQFIENIKKAIVSLFPYIAAFVKSFVVAVNIIASVISKISSALGRLFGKNTKKESKKTVSSFGNISSAIGGVGSSADDATGKAKKLKKELQNLQGFDEMNVLQENTDSGGGKDADGGGGGDIGDLGPLADLDLGNITDQMKELALNTDLVTAALWGLIGAWITWKLTQDALKALGIGLMIMGIVYAIQGLVKYLKDPSWKNFGQIVQGIGIAVLGLGVAILGLPGIVVGAIILIVGTIMKYWNEISSFLARGIEKMMWKSGEIRDRFGNLIGDIYDIFVSTLQSIFKGIDNLFKGLRTSFDGIITFVKGVFTGNWKQAWEGIKQIFSGTFQSLKGIAQTILSTISMMVRTLATTVGSAISSIFKGVINAVLRTIESQLNKPIDAINSLLSVINAVPGIKLGKLSRIRLPRLAKGGIINQPGRGIPVGSAIGGESGREGVIPLTDSQQMAMLGEAIGRYITVNANITNTMNGRVISRELQKINNESDFAFNR